MKDDRTATSHRVLQVKEQGASSDLKSVKAADEYGEDILHFLPGRTTSHMKDVIRIVLVDPNQETRDELRQCLSVMQSIWLSEVHTSYQKGIERAKELGGHLTIVTLDHDPVQAIELIQRILQSDPGAVVLPASVSTDSALILKAIRAGAREFLTLPTEASELLATVTRLLHGRDLSHVADGGEPKIITFTGATGGVGCTTIAVTLSSVWRPARSKRRY